ncbi:MAG: hypothetical protein GXO82_06485 [Chlorobi bacterium]|nr:hypothetical protein [Chlorobiota bacterium]
MGVCFHFGDSRYKKQLPALQSIEKIGLIGAGTMGIGIAIDILNKTDCRVVMIDIAETALQRAEAEIERYAGGLVKSLRLHESDVASYTGRVQYTRNYKELGNADLIWEVATERIDIKKTIFSLIEEHADLDRLAFIFSNTSSHTTAELAKLFSNNAFREKFLTGHGYYPFHANRLFDVMKGPYASEESFIRGIMFAGQMLEKKVIALERDHHGYVTDPIFQAMGQIISWDVKQGRDLVELPLVFAMMTANPFQVLDRTGHMPFTESARHMGSALPDNDRLRLLYKRHGRNYPEWIEALENSGRIGLASKEGTGFFAWEGKPGKEKPVRVYDPPSDTYIEMPEVDWEAFGSIRQARERDRKAAAIRSIEGLILVAEADDRGGKAFRRYVLPIMLYALDMIQDGYATPGQVDASTRVGLRFKYGMCEIVDGFLKHFGFDGFFELLRKAAAENPDLADLYDTEGVSGPRQGKPCLIHAMKEKNWNTLLGYGRVYGTPVTQRNFSTGDMDPYYNDILLYLPNEKDRVASLVFDNPLRGNVWNKYVLDQFDHALGTCVELFTSGRLGAILFTASGKGMRMLGADARMFNKGWFDPREGYRFLGEEEASYFTKAGMKIFRFLQESPIWTAGAFGEKWGGGAEFTYFLNLRYDLQAEGVEFDSLTRSTVKREKKNYNQPEINYAILAGFGGVQELRRLGLGDSVIDEIFMKGLTATRAYELGLSNAVADDEYKLLEKTYETLRVNQKFAAPWSASLYHVQKKRAFHEGIDDDALVKETGETFNPDKNPYISTGILRLLNMGGKNPPMDQSVAGELPGWSGKNYETMFLTE